MALASVWSVVVSNVVVCSLFMVMLAEVVGGQGAGSITDVNLAQAGLTLLGAVSATIITLVRGSLGAETSQKSLHSRACANIRLGNGSVVASISPQLHGIGNFSNMILCSPEAKDCAYAAAQHIWSFGGGEVLVIVLDPFQCAASGQEVECFKGACTNWHRDLIVRSADGSVQGGDESVIVHSGQCRGGLGQSSLLGRNQAASNFLRLVVCVIAGFPPERTQESDIAARLTSTLDESDRGASCTAHKVVLGDFVSDKPSWTYSKDWALWIWWVLSFSEWLLAVALSGVFAIDSYNAALGARRIVRSYVTDYTGTADIPTPFAKSVYTQGQKKRRYRFFKIEHRTPLTTRICRTTKLVVGGIVVPLMCQALWAAQVAGEYELLVKHRESKMWQVWVSSGVVCVTVAVGAGVLWRREGKRTGFSGRYKVKKPVWATATFVALGLSGVAIATAGQKGVVQRPAYALALCGVVQQWSCWALWLWGSQEALSAGTIGDRAPWESTALLVLSFASSIGLVVSTGNWNS